MNEWAKAFVVCSLSICTTSCTTSFLELRGECVIQTWAGLGYVLRKRLICDLPPPTDGEQAVRDREAMRVNPFPNLIDLGGDSNPADSMDPNLLEKSMKYPPAPEDKPND